ncbi:MAG: type II toxin-antitoxin system prevent-host-death family antitoxin [Cyanobacteria bacterium P01_G01_bin.39]
MESINYTEFRKNLADYLNKVEDDRIPLVVTRSNGRRVIVMNFDDYQTNEATLHLMSSQENIRVLDEAIAELENGGGTEVEIEVGGC